METFLKSIVTLSSHFAKAEGKNKIEPLHIFLAMLTVIFHRNKLDSAQRDEIAFSADDIAVLESLAFMLGIKIQIDDEKSRDKALDKIEDFLPIFDSGIETIFTTLNVTMPHGESLLRVAKDETPSAPLSEASATIFSFVDIAKLSVWNYAHHEAMVCQCLFTAIMGSRDQKIDGALDLTDLKFVEMVKVFLNDGGLDADDIMEDGEAILQALVNHGHTHALYSICRATAPVAQRSKFADALISSLILGCSLGEAKPPAPHSVNRMYALFLGLQSCDLTRDTIKELKGKVSQGLMILALTQILNTLPLPEGKG